MDVSDFYNFSTFYVLSLHGIMEKTGKLLSRHYSKPCPKLNLVEKSTNHYKLEICLPTGENSSSWKGAKNVSTLFIPIFYFVRCQRCLDLLRLFYSTCCIYKYRPEYYIYVDHYCNSATGPLCRTIRPHKGCRLFRAFHKKLHIGVEYTFWVGNSPQA